MQDALPLDGRPAQLADDRAAKHDQHAVAQRDQLLELRRDQHDADAGRRDLVDDGANLGLRADIDADGRLVHDEDLRLGLQPLGEQHLLLVAAGKLARLRLRAGRAHAQPRDVALGGRLHFLPVERAGEAGEARQDRQADVLGQRELRKDALAQPVAGEERDAGCKRTRRVAGGTGLPSIRTRPGGLASGGAEYRPGQFAEAGTGEPGDAHHLALRRARS